MKKLYQLMDYLLKHAQKCGNEAEDALNGTTAGIESDSADEDLHIVYHILSAILNDKSDAKTFRVQVYALQHYQYEGANNNVKEIKNVFKSLHEAVDNAADVYSKNL